MSRFYVGQKCRVSYVRNMEFNCRSGQECVIARFIPPESNGTDCFVRFMDGFEVAGGTCQLEPITDSYNVTTWDTCIWKPEHLQVPA